MTQTNSEVDWIDGVFEVSLGENQELLDWYLEAKIQPHIGSMVDKITARLKELEKGNDA